MNATANAYTFLFALVLTGVGLSLLWAITAISALWLVYQFAARPLRNLMESQSEVKRDATHFAIFGLTQAAASLCTGLAGSIIFPRLLPNSEIGLLDVLQPLVTFAIVLVWMQFGIFVGPWLRARAFVLRRSDFVRYVALLAICSLLVIPAVSEVIAFASTGKFDFPVSELITNDPQVLLMAAGHYFFILIVLLVLAKVHLWGIKRILPLGGPSASSDDRNARSAELQPTAPPRLLRTQPAEDPPQTQ